MSAVSKEIGRISKPGRRFTAKRRLPSGDAKKQRVHNLRVGEIVHAYNAAHASLFLLFWRFGGGGNVSLAKAIWHTAKTDRAQRDMLEAAVTNYEPLGAVYRRGILWAIASLNELSSLRNDVAHTEMIQYYDQAMLGLATKEQSRARLEATPFENYWRGLRGDFFAIANYLYSIEWSLLLVERLPSSKRPRLQLARSTSAQTQKRRHQAKKAARERQRQSSPR